MYADFLLLVYKKRIGSALILAKNEMIDKYSSASALHFWLIKMKGNIRLYALLISDQVGFGVQILLTPEEHCFLFLDSEIYTTESCVFHS